MIKTIGPLKGDKVHIIYARGRNGYFGPNTVFLISEEGKATMTLQVYSRRAADAAPIVLSLDKDDMEKVACAILGIDHAEVRRLQVSEGENLAMSVWVVEDVCLKAREKGACVTLEQANQILKNIDRKQDANYGISWDTVACAIDDLGQLPPCIYYDSNEADEVSCFACVNFKKEISKEAVKA